MVIIPLYLLEQLLKMWALGASRYFWDKGNVFDILITVSLVIVQIIYLAVFGIPYWGHDVVCFTKLHYFCMRKNGIIIFMRHLSSHQWSICNEYSVVKYIRGMMHLFISTVIRIT